jgi:amino acid adenylation domain-containing protein
MTREIHDAPPFRRPISATERLYFAGARLAPPFAIAIVVEGRGAIDRVALEAAVAEASRACPGARLVARGREWKDGGVAPKVRDVSGDGFEALEATVLREPLDPERGPTCEVVIVRREPFTLVFRAHHGVMDGKGALTWVKDVFRALRGEAPEGATSTETDLGLLEKLRPDGRRPKLALDCPSPWGAAPVTDTQFFWRRRTLRGAHPGLVAKIASIVVDASGEDHLRFMVPVDLRRHVPAMASTANMSLPIFLDAARGERWEEIHERLLGALADKRELARDGTEGAMGKMPLWGLAGIINLAVRRQRKTGKYLGAGVLSHLGRIDLAAFSAAPFEATTLYSLPVHAPLAPFSLVAVECASHVELTLSAPVGDGMEARADALLDRIVAALAADHVWPGNRTDAPFPAHETIVRLFEAQAASTPDATALVQGERTVTYRELDRRANLVAHALRSRGVGATSIVGLLSDRTIDALVALWGILKAGAAYLPIDPQYPRERIGYMLADTAAPICLAQATYESHLAGVFAGETLRLDGLDDGTAPAAPSAVAGPDDRVYVIYTSGSTGRPKGVQITHRNLVNYVHWARHVYDVDAASRFALFTSLSFDLSATSFLVPLLAGGSVALVPEELDHVTLQTVLERSGANALKLTPTHLELMGRLGLVPAGYRTIVVGGEQLKGAVAARAQEMFGPQCRIINEYGPTETTIGCVYHVFDLARDGRAAAVPIGLPSWNVRIHLLDPERAPVARGATGEIYIAGEGLARGYLNRDELNRERFVHLDDGTRAYRTGDLARILPDGVLEFLGRTDDQIKIRGHRIEPGEIARALEEHPRVKRAVVLGRAPGAQQEKLLCAYVVAEPAIDEAEARAYLEARLPRHMVPSFFVPIDHVPLTVNGKIDARALPDPFAGRARTDGASAPRDEVEAAVAAIWSSLLKLDAGGLAPDADFYRLGGDSLSMVEMLSAVARRVVGAGHEAAFMQSARPIIKHPTLDNVCRAVNAARAPSSKVA